MRQPKPYFRAQKQAWYVQIDGRQFSLGRDEQAAWNRYHELMAGRVDLSSKNSTVRTSISVTFRSVERKQPDVLAAVLKNAGPVCRRPAGRRIVAPSEVTRRLAFGISDGPVQFAEVVEQVARVDRNR